MVFTVLTFAQLAHVLATKNTSLSLLTTGLFSNRLLLVAIALTVTLQLLVIYVPIFNPIFKTTPLNIGELAPCLTLSLVIIAAVEIEKWLVRRGLIYKSSISS
ncbi:MAG: cation-translocating P-type ATPase C-terminal domain-containing protein [Gammaproteobacteria bacterium]|nr:cation-translocating P-type ATPase C-terminal domain-containing protein [Gammaproteobacteria bacterium]